jgi:hypothetical protein
MLGAGEKKRIGMRIAWRRRLPSRAAAVAAAVAAGSVLASCSPAAPAAKQGAAPGRSTAAAAPSAAAASPSPAAAAPSGGVISLTAISTLRSLFNRDNGHPRLVLIFSPT